MSPVVGTSTAFGVYGDGKGTRSGGLRTVNLQNSPKIRGTGEVEQMPGDRATWVKLKGTITVREE